MKKLKIKISKEEFKEKLGLTDGLNGRDGRDGKDGQDGRTPIKGVDYFDGQPGSLAEVNDLAILETVLGHLDSLETSFKLVDKINSLPTDSDRFKIDASHIKGLKYHPNNLNSGKTIVGGLHYLPGAGISINGSVISATGTSTSFIDNEIVGGSGTTFTLLNVPILNSEHLFALGQRLTPLVDYTISGATITTLSTWSSGQILADYRK